MPKIKDLTEELKMTQAQIKTDPTHWFTLLTRVRAPLYLKLIESALEHDEQPLTPHVAQLLSDYFEEREGGGFTLDQESLLTLKTLCTLWGVSPSDAVKKVFEKKANELLREEMDSREQKREFLQFLQQKG
jgi:hypothetical protein